MIVRIICITLLLIANLSSKGGTQQTDTVPEVSVQIIDEVVNEPTPPTPEKAEYISQLTRYGFKNLFSKNPFNNTSQINPQAENYIREYLVKHTAYLNNLKLNSRNYFNLIDQILSIYGLPKELKYLAVIESNLQTSATSWVGAAGPWQFMPGTARDYGLTVNASLDERRDYFKSTHAASKYLLNLYKQFNDWLLVIAAYNGGPGRVYEAIKKSGSRNFWTLQHYLPEESKNHVKKFIATHFVMESESNNAFGSMSLNNTAVLNEEQKNNTLTQTISGKYLSKVICTYIEMDQKTFDHYNPNFDLQLEMNSQFDLILPKDKMSIFLANKYDILNASVQELLNPQTPPPTKTVYPKKSYKKRG